MPSRKTLLTASIIFVLLITGAGLGVYSTRFYRTSMPSEAIQGLLWPNPKQLGEFSAINQNGDTFNISNLHGHWSLLFFGYTYCPDVCPVTLSVLEQVQTRLQQEQSLPALQTIFITGDPERDTTTRLAEYIGYFKGNFSALGGTIEQINSLASQIGIAYSLDMVQENGSYMVNHTSSVFLIDPQARLVGIFSAPHNPDDLTVGITNISGFINSQN